MNKTPPVYFLKLGLATALAYLACEAMGSRYPFYAVVSVIVVLQPTLGTTWRSGLRRVGGTLVGIPLGGLLAWTHVPPVLATGLGVAGVVFVCTRAGLREGVPVSAFALGSIVLNHPTEPWLFAGQRLLDTLTGIGIALIVNRFFWPPRAAEELRKMLRAYYGDSARLLHALMDCYLGEPYDGAAIDALREPLRAVPIEGPALWAEARQESSSPPGWTDQGAEFLVKRMREHLLAIDHAAAGATDDPVPRPCAAQLRELSQQCEQAYRALAAERVFEVFPMQTAVAALEEQAAHLGQAEVRPLMRFFTVASNLTSIANKLEHMLQVTK